jgi:multicomponent Na+:H+ antiporter subunit D
VLLLSIGIVLFCTLLVGRSMIEDKHKQSNFSNIVLLSLIGMNGTVLVTDLFSMYVFLEVGSVASFVLIALKRDNHALEGAIKYLILSAVATVLMISGVALMLMLAGSVSFAAVAAALRVPGSPLLAQIAVGAFTCGLLIKGGMVPFHGWLPDAYSAAPAAVSVLLAGIVTKVMGIYGLVRLSMEVFPHSAPLSHALMVVGVVSIVVGALAALVQSDLKRMLAYSSISQIGYIVLALGCAISPAADKALVAGMTLANLALIGAVFHLFNHAIFKTLLFVNAAALEQRLGTSDMTRMVGLGGRMPVTSTTSIIAALSVSGVPPLSGFWSKVIIIIALWMGGFHVYATIAILMSVVTLAYLLGMQRKIFFGKVSQEFAQVREAAPGVVVPAVVLAALTVAVGLAFPWVWTHIILPVASLP